MTPHTARILRSELDRARFELEHFQHDQEELDIKRSQNAQWIREATARINDMITDLEAAGESTAAPDPFAQPTSA